MTTYPPRVRRHPRLWRLLGAAYADKKGAPDRQSAAARRARESGPNASDIFAIVRRTKRRHRRMMERALASRAGQIALQLRACGNPTVEGAQFLRQICEHDPDKSKIRRLESTMSALRHAEPGAELAVLCRRIAQHCDAIDLDVLVDLACGRQSEKLLLDLGSVFNRPLPDAAA